MLSCFYCKINFTFSNLFEIGRTDGTTAMHMVSVVEAHFYKLDLGEAVCALVHNINYNPKRRRGPATDYVCQLCRLIYYPPNRICDSGAP